MYITVMSTVAVRMKTTNNDRNNDRNDDNSLIWATTRVRPLTSIVMIIITAMTAIRITAL